MILVPASIISGSDFIVSSQSIPNVLCHGDGGDVLLLKYVLGLIKLGQNTGKLFLSAEAVFLFTTSELYRPAVAFPVQLSVRCVNAESALALFSISACPAFRHLTHFERTVGLLISNSACSVVYPLFYFYY